MTRLQVALAWAFTIIAMVIYTLIGEHKEQPIPQDDRAAVMMKTCEFNAKALGCDNLHTSHADYQPSHAEYQQFTEVNK